MLSQTAVIAVLAIGQLLVILTRGIDLSVGSNLALASVVGALAFQHGALGLVGHPRHAGLGRHGRFRQRSRFYVWGRMPHPFIITLATLSIARGSRPAVVGRPTTAGHARDRADDRQRVRRLVALLDVPRRRDRARRAVIGTRLVWGRWIYAVGGNPEAARRTGIPVRAVLISVYVLCGLLAGVAAIITSGRLNAGSPTSGSLAELDSIAAVIIGGASFLGGRGTVSNALVGALMIGVIRNGMNLLNVDAFLQPIVIGVVIVLAVESDVLRARLEERFRVLQAALT